MTEPTDRPPDRAEQLEPSDSPQAALEGDLSTVTDDEFFDAAFRLDGAEIVGREEDGTVHDPLDTVADLRGLAPAARDQQRRMLDEVGR